MIASCQDAFRLSSLISLFVMLVRFFPSHECLSFHIILIICVNIFCVGRLERSCFLKGVWYGRIRRASYDLHCADVIPVVIWQDVQSQHVGQDSHLYSGCEGVRVSRYVMVGCTFANKQPVICAVHAELLHLLFRAQITAGVGLGSLR